MEADLFGAKHHDAGGKVKTALPPGLKGSAVFAGGNREYRPLLYRWIGDKFPDRYIVFIGMNPSTADADANDPTIGREWGFTQREGYDGFVKLNVVDYRATMPADLLNPGLDLESAQHAFYFTSILGPADKIVLCHGKLSKPLIPARDRLYELLASQFQAWCFGTNADGSPKHPLYLRADTPLIPWEKT